MSNTNYNDIWDPTSSASLTSMGLVAAGVCSVMSSAYIFGKFRTEKQRSEYQASMLCFVCGLLVYFVALYIAYAYD